MASSVRQNSPTLQGRPTSQERPTLEERFTLAQGRVLLSGNEALVRMALAQRRRDVAIGLNTAGFVSGYRGSPLARIDREFQKVQHLLKAHHIVFRPGVNEDLAATAVWGSQQLGLFPGARYDGVFSLWYGKGPGVDRSMDAIRHAQACGTDPHGGVLLLVGDDHGAVSSTLPHQSEHNLISAMVPMLSPGGVGEFIDYGLLGWAMSRYSGAWVGFKCQTDIVESTASVDVDPRIAAHRHARCSATPAAGSAFAGPTGRTRMERRLSTRKCSPSRPSLAPTASIGSPSAAGPARVGVDAPRARPGSICMGALAMLGIDEARAAALGLRVYKIGLVWPLEPEGLECLRCRVSTLCSSSRKSAGVIEDQVKSLLFNRPRRPAASGYRQGRISTARRCCRHGARSAP